MIEMDEWQVFCLSAIAAIAVLASFVYVAWWLYSETLNWSNWRKK